MDSDELDTREVLLAPADLCDLFESALGAVDYWAEVVEHDEAAGAAVLRDRADGTRYPVAYLDLGEHLCEYFTWAVDHQRGTLTIEDLLEYGDDDDYDALLQFTVLGAILYE